MVQWVNRLRNNIFVNLPPLPLLCETSEALHLAQPGLTAGWQRKYVIIANPSALYIYGFCTVIIIQVNFKVGCRSKYSTCRFV